MEVILETPTPEPQITLNSLGEERGYIIFVAHWSIGVLTYKDEVYGICNVSDQLTWCADFQNHKSRETLLELALKSPSVERVLFFKNKNEYLNTLTDLLL